MPKQTKRSVLRRSLGPIVNMLSGLFTGVCTFVVVQVGRIC